jgi:hypothetical protein
VEGKFLSATTPTYIIVFVCLSASTDDKKKPEQKQRAEIQRKKKQKTGNRERVKDENREGQN